MWLTDALQGDMSSSHGNMHGEIDGMKSAQSNIDKN